MTNPRITGISSITGKTVYIRHAAESELIDIQAYLKRHKMGDRELEPSDVVVAVENDRIIGFGIMEKIHDHSAGCATIVEDGRRRGIGASIVRHLIEYAPVRTVYIGAGVQRYFTRLGFTRTRTAQQKHADIAVESMCRSQRKRSPSLPAYEKR
jgi:N-acetylglutamate synthase-like GNAT family acetyltransferase